MSSLYRSAQINPQVLRYTLRWAAVHTQFGAQGYSWRERAVAWPLVSLQVSYSHRYDHA